MGAENIYFIKARVVKVPLRGEVNDSTLHSEDPDYGIRTELSKRSDGNVVSAGGYSLHPLKATKPHTDGPHAVYWVVSQKTGIITPWNEQSVIEFAKDSAFLGGVEKFIRQSQDDNPNLRCYFFLGYAYNQGEKYPDHVSPKGLQSQPRIHFHFVEPVTGADSRPINLQNEVETRRLACALNIPGEDAIAHFITDGTENFGFTNVVKYSAPFESENIPRTFFGFNSLEEAINQSLELQCNVKKEWINYLASLADIYHNFAHYTIKTMQSCIPNVAIIFPSKLDRLIGKTNDNYPVWAAPFSITGGLPLLLPNPVVIPVLKK